MVSIWILTADLYFRNTCKSYISLSPAYIGNSLGHIGPKYFRLCSNFLTVVLGEQTREFALIRKGKLWQVISMRSIQRSSSVTGLMCFTRIMIHARKWISGFPTKAMVRSRLSCSSMAVAGSAAISARIPCRELLRLCLKVTP